jgi:hypothetical protein
MPGSVRLPACARQAAESCGTAGFLLVVLRSASFREHEGVGEGRGDEGMH